MQPAEHAYAPSTGGPHPAFYDSLCKTKFHTRLRSPAAEAAIQREREERLSGISPQGRAHWEKELDDNILPRDDPFRESTSEGRLNHNNEI